MLKWLIGGTAIVLVSFILIGGLFYEASESEEQACQIGEGGEQHISGAYSSDSDNPSVVSAAAVAEECKP